MRAIDDTCYIGRGILRIPGIAIGMRKIAVWRESWMYVNITMIRVWKIFVIGNFHK